MSFRKNQTLYTRTTTFFITGRPTKNVSEWAYSPLCMFGSKSRTQRLRNYASTGVLMSPEGLNQRFNIKAVAFFFEKYLTRS